MQGDQQMFVDVILPLATGSTFTYSVPVHLQTVIAIGKRIVVQFGKRKVYSALVRKIHSNAPQHYQTKEILSVLDNDPIVNGIQLDFWDWISDYYMCTPGEVFKAAVPSGLKLESQSYVSVLPDFDLHPHLSDKELQILSYVESKKRTTIDDIAMQFDIRNIYPVIQTLSAMGAIEIFEVISEKYSPKKETYIDAGGDINDPVFVNEAYNLLSKAPKQQEAFLNFVRMSMETLSKKGEPVAKKEFIKHFPTGDAVLRSLFDKGFLVEVHKRVSRIEQGGFNISECKPLTDVQEQCKADIERQFKEKDIVLLHGVTASGKTEIYIQLIKETISRGKQVLYLLPEIALTTQIISRLGQVFGSQVGVYHSKFNEKERVEIWNTIVTPTKEQSYTIILGVRSSIFLPFDNLGLVIIDEEHENTFKQYDPAPRYNGRDSAIVLAKLHNAKVLLGTATPSIETYYNTKTGKYGIAGLLQRHSNVVMPAITLVDIKDETRKKRMYSHFSKTLLEKMQSALDRREQIILFQNRRGFAPYIECTDCGTIPTCIHCDVSLTFHRFTNRLVCHYCGYSLPNSATCVACGSHRLESRGFGTEKIEEEIQQHFPQAKVSRMDLDSTRAKHAHSDIITSFQNKEVDILVGTQMVTKGLDFENVSLVGIMNADLMLNQPDFRAHERSFQLMIQVAGRAGRNKTQGEVIIQTNNPTHPILQMVQRDDYQEMLNTQLGERHQYSYPPYSRLIRISIKHRDMALTQKAAKAVADMLRERLKNAVLGPEFPPVSKIQNLYIMNILLKLDKSVNLPSIKSYIGNSLISLNTQQEFKSVETVINVDPY